MEVGSIHHRRSPRRGISTYRTRSASLHHPGRVSGGLEHGLVAHLGHGIVQPGGLQVAVVPLVEIANQVAGVLAENAHDRFAGKAGLRGHVKFDCLCPLFFRLCQL